MIWAALLIGFGAGVAYRTRAAGSPEDVPLTRGGDGRHRLLVVANETVGGEALLEEIGERCRGRECEILVSRRPWPPRAPTTGPPTSTKRSSSPASGWSSR